MRLKYNTDMIEFLKMTAPGKRVKEITEIFNLKFSLKKTNEQIASLMKRKKIKTGNDGRFKKGNVPPLKGKKGIGGWKPTQFKKGSIPCNYMPIGTERINSDGYIDVKVTTNKWKQKHRIIWEEINGPVPQNCCLIFSDQNKLNVSLENLILVTRRELFKMNQEKLIKNNKELTEVGHTIAKLKIKIYDRTKNNYKEL